MTENIEIQILAFGQVAEITGLTNWKISDVSSTDALNQKLITQFPALAKLKFAVAVNKKIISENTMLQTGDTVALLPPFSGG